MNDLIEKLFEQYSTEEELFDGFGFPYTVDVAHVKDFTQAIQTACKAQRNACLRSFKEHYPSITSRSKGTIEVIIKNAQIERQDYE